MKTITISIATIAVILTGAQYNVIKDYCTAAITKKKCKETLKPFQYDASKVSKLTFKYKPAVKEVEVPLYFGESYRFVFNREGLPQHVDVNVYNKPFDNKKRVLLWTTKGKPETQNEFVWEPEKSRKMYVNYSIPATNDTIKKGCIVFVLGYKIKNPLK